MALLGAGSMGTAIVRRIGAGKKYSSGRMFGTLNFTEYCEYSVRSDEKYHAVLEEAQRIHSVAWYISMITDDYISLDEELQELEKQREFDGNLYTFN